MLTVVVVVVVELPGVVAAMIVIYLGEVLVLMEPMADYVCPRAQYQRRNSARWQQGGALTSLDDSVNYR
jgi:hypothetical protein